MYGAIIGDIVGSKYEFRPTKSKDFPFVSEGCAFTDDTVMTVAVARALMKARHEDVSFKAVLVAQMRGLGRRYPSAGYGGRFDAWLESSDPKPYNSYGNGSAMRVSPCGLVAVDLDEALALARASAEVTHDHPEGVKGAQAVAAAVYLAKSGYDKQEIGDYVRENFYPLDRTLGEIRPGYSFDVTCQGSVPEAITCFLESDGYEDAVRNAVSLGGDADTQAAIAGSIAWAYYRVGGEHGGERSYGGPDAWPEWCERTVADYGIDAMLPAGFVDTIREFNVLCPHRYWSYDRMGMCKEIPL